MNRLTFDGNFCDIALCLETRGGVYCGDSGCSQKQVWERLKEYEDTELPPDICRNYKIFEDEAISRGFTFNDIIELMTKKEQGLLVKLPCKVGDTVYDIYEAFHNGEGDVRALKVTDIHIHLDKRNKAWIIIGGYYFALDDFGKTVFLTREEAEKALE